MGLIRKIFGESFKELREKELELIKKRAEQEKQKIKKVQEEQEKQEIEKVQEEEKIRLEKQKQYADMRRIRKENKINDFNNTLSTLYRHDIKLTNTKHNRNTVSNMPDFKFTNITLKTITEKISCFVAVDTETTGLKASDDIIELSAIRYEDFTPTECFTTLIKPRKEISKKITDITGINNEMVESAPELTTIVESFLEFIGDDILVGHNLSFDLKMLWSNGINVFDSKRKYYDTLELSQKTLKKIKEKWDKEYGFYEPDYDSNYDVEDYKLDTICDFYEIYRDVSHRSLSDCLATGYVFKRLVEARTEKKL